MVTSMVVTAVVKETHMIEFVYFFRIKSTKRDLSNVSSGVEGC